MLFGKHIYEVVSISSLVTSFGPIILALRIDLCNSSILCLKWDSCISSLEIYVYGLGLIMHW